LYESQAEISGRVVVGGLRLLTRDPAETWRDLFLHIHGRKLGKDHLQLVPWNPLKRVSDSICIDRFQRYSDYRFLVQSDSAGGVERDGVPDQSDLLLRNSTLLQE